jgi:hypothetical protein
MTSTVNTIGLGTAAIHMVDYSVGLFICSFLGSFPKASAVAPQSALGSFDHSRGHLLGQFRMHLLLN